MPDYETRHPAFGAVIDEAEPVRRLATGMQFIEGPVWIAEDQRLIFSDIPASKLMTWHAGRLSVWREQSHNANGNTRDHAGRLITCEHGTRRVTRTEADGSITVLATHWQGRRFNSPNDPVVDSRGDIWFTDPPYGLPGFPDKSAQELPLCFVFRLSPLTGSMQIVTDAMMYPNGLCFDTAERHLYIADSHEGYHQVKKFPVGRGGELGAPELFCTVENGVPDGMRIDTDDRVYVTTADGVEVYRADGTLLGKVLTPEVVANCCFGGPDYHTLFMTGSTSLYAVRLKATGAQR